MGTGVPPGVAIEGQERMQEVATLLKALEHRRRELGISLDLLAERSGVSRLTVYRILTGRHAGASLFNILAIADSLGLALRIDSEVAPQELKQEQAERKAKRLVSLVQGTSGLEGQAVDRQTIATMVERTTHELLTGPSRKLWSEE